MKYVILVGIILFCVYEIYSLAVQLKKKKNANNSTEVKKDDLKIEDDKKVDVK